MIRKIILTIASFAILSLGGLIGYWITDDELPYEYITGAILPAVAPQGAQMSLPWTMKVNRLCPGNVLRVLYDDDTGEMVAAYDRTPSSISVKMGDTHLVKTFTLPSRPLPPRIRYTANVCFVCNPWHRIEPLCVDTPMLRFRMMPPFPENSVSAQAVH